MTYEERFDAGAAALREGQADVAVEQLRECVTENPNDQRAQLYLGVAFGLTGAEEDAERHLRAALQLDPANPQAHFNLARLRHRQNRLDEAVTGYQEVLRLDPDHAKAQQELQALGKLPVDLISPRMTPETPVATVRFGGARDVTARRVDVVSALRSVGLASGVFMVLYGAAIYGWAHHAKVQQLVVQGIYQMIGGPLMALIGVPIMVAIYNALSGWLGPVAVDLSEEGDGYVVERIDGLSAARMASALIVVAVMVVGLIYCGLIVAMLAGLGSSLGPGLGAAGSAGVAVAMLIGLAIGAVIGVGAGFVVVLLQVAIYNLVAPGLGGARVSAKGQFDRLEITRISPWSTVLCWYVANLPFTLLALAMAFLMGSLVPTDSGTTPLLYATPVLAFVNALLQVLLYNLFAKLFGGMCVTLDED